jgi:cyclophilin family peptidyl-prolyl cis-trans isomerase
MVAVAQRSKRRRQSVIAVGGAIVIVGLLFFFGPLGGSDDDEPTAAAPTSSTAPTTVVGDPEKCPPKAGTSKRFTSFPAPPKMCIDPTKKYLADIKTDVGTITVELEAGAAPNTVNNFVFLARNRYYDGIIFHRVIPDFMDQTGDPLGTGAGGPGYQFADEIPEGYVYQEGDIAMANSGPNTNGSQFFLVASEKGAETLLSAVGGVPKYTPFGKVIKGMSVVKKINNDGSGGGSPNVEHKMISVTITEE